MPYVLWTYLNPLTCGILLLFVVIYCVWVCSLKLYETPNSRLKWRQNKQKYCWSKPRQGLKCHECYYLGPCVFKRRGHFVVCAEHMRMLQLPGHHFVSVQYLVLTLKITWYWPYGKIFPKQRCRKLFIDMPSSTCNRLLGRPGHSSSGTCTSPTTLTGLVALFHSSWLSAWYKIQNFREYIASCICVRQSLGLPTWTTAVARRHLYNTSRAQ